jgi:hypothetical protein
MVVMVSPEIFRLDNADWLASLYEVPRGTRCSVVEINIDALIEEWCVIRSYCGDDKGIQVKGEYVPE